MKKIISLFFGTLFIGLIFAACGGDGETTCTNSILIGSWDVGTNHFTFQDNCSFTESTCSLVGTYTKATETSGTTKLTVTSSSGAESCFEVGTHNCSYSISGSSLNYTCAIVH